MIITNIKSQQLIARKEQNKTLASILTALYSEVSIVGKNNGNRETNDDESIAVIKKFIKNISENISIFKDRNKDISDLEYELNVYNSFLPKQLSKEELESIISNVMSTIDNPSIKSMGAVMASLNKDYKGLFDGALASSLIKAYFN